MPKVTTPDAPSHRAHFDAEIGFGNGGGLQTQDFQLDIPGHDIDEAELGALLIEHLGLPMVESVSISALRVVAEPHQGSRGKDPHRPAPASAGTRRLIDLTHVIRSGLITYPGLPGPEITPHLTRAASAEVYAPGTTFAIDRISMVGNTGTYLDSPFHRYQNGKDLAQLELASFADLPVVLVSLTDSGGRGIDAPLLQSLDVAGKAVLLHTGWDRHFGSPEYGGPAPFLTEAGAEWLVVSGARLVGIDSVNIDDTDGTRARPAHSRLLAADIPVLEHLTHLAEVPTQGARLHAAPPPVAGFGTFPVRAYVVVDR